MQLGVVLRYSLLWVGSTSSHTGQACNRVMPTSTAPRQRERCVYEHSRGLHVCVPVTGAAAGTSLLQLPPSWVWVLLLGVCLLLTICCLHDQALGLLASSPPWWEWPAMGVTGSTTQLRGTCVLLSCRAHAWWCRGLGVGAVAALCSPHTVLALVHHGCATNTCGKHTQCQPQGLYRVAVTAGGHLPDTAAPVAAGCVHWAPMLRSYRWCVAPPAHTVASYNVGQGQPWGGGGRLCPYLCGSNVGARLLCRQGMLQEEAWMGQASLALGGCVQNCVI
jgi:hypothetical protein